MTKRDAAVLHLAAVARAALGGERVVTAGIFGWQDLVRAQVAVVGGRAATDDVASAHGMTMQLLVAVTDRVIALFNWDGRVAGDRVEVFDRETTAVRISRMGMSKVVKLHDDASGSEISLHASVAPYLTESKADKRVLAALTAMS